MTVATTSNKISYLGDGATTAFPFSFSIQLASDIDVFVTDSFGNITQIAPNLFSVFVNAPTGTNPTPVGGQVSYSPGGSPLPNGKTVTIVRTEDLTQPQSFANQGTLYQSVIEAALDRLTLMVQQLVEQSNRSLVVSVSDPAPAPLPPVAQRAGFVAVFDSSGNLVPGSTPAVLFSASIGNGISANVTSTNKIGGPRAK